MAVAWLIFTTTLGSWWVYFSIKQYQSLSSTSWENSSHILKYQRMLVFESFVFLLLVVLGGGALIYYFSKENQMLKERESFFAAFTHDLKTTITSHRLSVERLQETKATTNYEKNLKNMLRESQTLGLKLDNALKLSQINEEVIILREFRFSQIISSVKRMFPDLKVTMNHDIYLQGDRVCLTSVIINIFQNSIQHASATEIYIENFWSKGTVCAELSHNGGKLSGEVHKGLGRSYFYRGEYQGSGLGLFISRKLLRKMNADLEFFKNEDQRFTARIKFYKGELI